MKNREDEEGYDRDSYHWDRKQIGNFKQMEELYLYHWGRKQIGNFKQMEELYFSYELTTSTSIQEINSNVSRS